MASQVSFGSVDEVLLPTSSIMITEHPFHLNLLGSPATTSVASVASVVENRKELGLEQATTPATSVASVDVVENRKELGMRQATTTTILASMSKECRDLIRNELWIEKVNIIQSQYLSI